MNTKICPACREAINEAATRCRYCRVDLVICPHCAEWTVKAETCLICDEVLGSEQTKTSQDEPETIFIQDVEMEPNKMLMSIGCMIVLGIAAFIVFLILLGNVSMEYFGPCVIVSGIMVPLCVGGIIYTIYRLATNQYCLICKSCEHKFWVKGQLKESTCPNCGLSGGVVRGKEDTAVLLR